MSFYPIKALFVVSCLQFDTPAKDQVTLDRTRVFDKWLSLELDALSSTCEQFILF